MNPTSRASLMIKLARKKAEPDSEDIVSNNAVWHIQEQDVVIEGTMQTQHNSISDKGGIIQKLIKNTGRNPEESQPNTVEYDAEEPRSNTIGHDTEYDVEETEAFITGYDAKVTGAFITGHDFEETEAIITGQDAEETEGIITGRDAKKTEAIITGNDAEETEAIITGHDAEKIEAIITGQDSKETEPNATGHDSDEPKPNLIVNDFDKTELNLAECDAEIESNITVWRIQEQKAVRDEVEQYNENFEDAIIQLTYNKNGNTDSTSDSDKQTSVSSHDSDDSDVDPNYEKSSSSASYSSTTSSDEEFGNIQAESNEVAKRKVIFASELKKKSRKRKKNMQNWQKNKSKLLRNSGQKYQYTKIIKKDDGTLEKIKSIRDARKLMPPCGEKCRLKCSKKILQEERQTIFDEYWKMADLQRQRDFIAANMTPVTPKYRYRMENSQRGYNSAFYFDRIEGKARVCKYFFIATLGISGRVIRTVQDKLNSSETGIISTESRGKHKNHSSVPDEVKDTIRHHINSIPRIDSHYCRARSAKQYIEGDKTISDLYRDYKNMCQNEHWEYANYQMYYAIFNQEFNLSFFSPKKDQCELCSQFINSNEAEKSKIQEKYATHLKEKVLSRIEKENDKKSSSFVAVYDLQAVLPCPRGDVSSFYYLSKLNVFNLTIFDLISNDVSCYIWHEGQANRGSNEIATCVWRYLEQIHKSVNETDTDKKSTNVIFYSDNCAGQNKNINIISMYKHAISKFDTIESITHKYFITGHSQNEGDCAHSVIERQVKKARKSAPIYVPDQYVSIIRSAKKTGKPYTVHELCYQDFLDFKNLNQCNKKNTDGEIFKISEVKVLKLERDKPHQLLYKNSYSEQDFKTVPLFISTPRRKLNKMQEMPLKKAYTSKTGITEAKKKGYCN